MAHLSRGHQFAVPVFGLRTFGYDDEEPLVDGVTECPPGCEHDFGEVFDYLCCEPCEAILATIEAIEL